MRDVVNAGAVELIEATVAAGASPAAARKWWMGELARTAKQQEVELADLPITPAQIGALQSLVDSGRINDKLARQVLEGVLAGEGDPEAVVVARGLEVVSDDGPLLEAIDAALAAQPDVGGQDPLGQPRAGRRDHRRRHEGDARPGRRRPRARARARAHAGVTR